MCYLLGTPPECTGEETAAAQKEPPHKEDDYSIIDTNKPKTVPVGPTEAMCNMCSAQFPSKSKLFQHLKESGHAIKPEFAPKLAAGGKKGRRAKSKKT